MQKGPGSCLPQTEPPEPPARCWSAQPHTPAAPGAHSPGAVASPLQLSAAQPLAPALAPAAALPAQGTAAPPSGSGRSPGGVCAWAVQEARSTPGAPAATTFGEEKAPAGGLLAPACAAAGCRGQLLEAAGSCPPRGTGQTPQSRSALYLQYEPQGCSTSGHMLAGAMLSPVGSAPGHPQSLPPKRLSKTTEAAAATCRRRGPGVQHSCWGAGAPRGATCSCWCGNPSLVLTGNTQSCRQLPAARRQGSYT